MSDSPGLDRPSWWLRLARLVLLPLAWLFERLGNRFYMGLALALAMAFAWALGAGLTRGMQTQAYDFIVKNRVLVPEPHPDLMLIDIDEASLAALAPEFGRWPWPRSVMAEMVDHLAAAGSKAIVFDITFSDADLDHRDADAYLRDVAASVQSTYFPMIRLNPDNDHLSELRLADLAGVRPLANPEPDATVAMIVPYFTPVLSGLRLGTNNLTTGADGIARSYHLYRDVAGWRVGSLPANLVSSLGLTLPDKEDILLNWRGPPGAYPSRSFHSLYAALGGADGAAVAEQFRGKVVVIGSTAPSLFDLKPTPLAQNHPGLEILATAIDNLLSGDELRQVSPLLSFLVTAVLLGLLAAAFVYNMDYRLLNPVFTLVQITFLVVTFVVLNYSSLFVDLTAPFTAGLVFFTFARGYHMALNLGRNGHPLFSTVLDQDSQCQVLTMLVVLPDDPSEARSARALLLRQAGMTHLGIAAPRMFRQSPLLAALYRDTLLLYWLVPPARSAAALDDLFDMLEPSLAKLARRGAGQQCHVHLDAFDFTVDEAGRWRDVGRLALGRALALPTDTAGDAPVQASPEFKAACAATAGADMAARLRLAEGVTG